MNRRQIVKTVLGAIAAIVAVPKIARGAKLDDSLHMGMLTSTTSSIAPVMAKEDMRTPEEVYAAWDKQISAHVDNCVSDPNNNAKYWKGPIYVDQNFWNRLIAKQLELGETPDIRNTGGRDFLVIRGCVYIITNN